VVTPGVRAVGRCGSSCVLTYDFGGQQPRLPAREERVGLEEETLRFPTNLDHAAIVARLVKIRESAQASGLSDLVSILADVDAIPSAQIGARVIAALTSVQDKPEFKSIATMLQIVAVNLKNLK
jgi:hypothetical protein